MNFFNFSFIKIILHQNQTLTSMNSLRNSQKRIPNSKPFIIFDTLIDSKTLPIFLKKAPKHAKKISISGRLKITLKIRNLKTLRSIFIEEEEEEESFDLSYYRFFKKRRINITLKALKPYHKSLKSYGASETLDEVERYLQNIAKADLHVGYDSAFKNFFRMINFEKIVFNFQYERNNWGTQTDPKILDFIQKVKSRLIRHIRKLRKVKEIQLHVNGWNLQTFAALLEIIQQNPTLLPSLKNLKLTTQKHSRPCQIVPTDHEAQIIKKALPYLTFLQTFRYQWFSPPFSYKYLRNIQEMNIQIDSAHLDHSNLEIQLLAFKNLSRLRALKLNFFSFNREYEKMFLNNFTLPSSLEKFDFILRGWEWKDGELTKKVKEKIEIDFNEHPRYINFFNEWKTLPNLKELFITIWDSDEQRDSVSICASFAAHIFKNLKSLVQVGYWNNISRPEHDPSSKTKPKPVKPAEFKKIWQSLVPSRKTLESINFRTPGMNFVSSINSIETNFPKLKSLSLYGQVHWATEAMHFARAVFDKKKEKSLDFFAYGIYVEDLKRFATLLNNINILPAGIAARFSFDMSNLKGEVWVDDFCRFFHELKTEGYVTLQLYNVSIQSYKAVQKVKSSVLKNRVLSGFEMKYILHERFYFRIDKGQTEAEDYTNYLVSKGEVKMDL